MDNPGTGRSSFKIKIDSSWMSSDDVIYRPSHGNIDIKFVSISSQIETKQVIAHCILDGDLVDIRVNTDLMNEMSKFIK